MPIQILCKQPGFRRLGMAHPAQAVYPDGYFTAAQIAVLRAEPMLVVTEVAEAGAAPTSEAKGRGKK